MDGAAVRKDGHSAGHGGSGVNKNQVRCLIVVADAYILALRQIIYSNQPEVARAARERVNDLGSAWTQERTGIEKAMEEA